MLTIKLRYQNVDIHSCVSLIIRNSIATGFKRGLITLRKVIEGNDAEVHAHIKYNLLFKAYVHVNNLGYKDPH